MSRKKGKKSTPPPSEGAIKPVRFGLILPDTYVRLPTTPFEQRQVRLPFRPPPENSLAGAHLKRRMATDVAFQNTLKEKLKRLSQFGHARTWDGSNLRLSNLLRWYFKEYANRFFTMGFDSLPCSFAIIEAFLRFNREFLFFDLRDEVEHLLSIQDYLRWYTGAAVPLPSHSLIDILEEGKIFSYEFVGDVVDVGEKGVSEQIITGVAMVRHSYELSCLLLAGETPPPISRETAQKLENDDTFVTEGRENLRSAPGLTYDNGFLDGHPNFSKVVVLARFDLRANQYHVRYVNIDVGTAFSVLTDDPSVLADLPPKDAVEYRENAIRHLSRYDNLFSVLSSLLFLPAFFAASRGTVHDFSVATPLLTSDGESAIAALKKHFPNDTFAARRTLHCLQLSDDRNTPATQTIVPPPLQSKRDGYWKILGPLEIGEDADHNAVVGRTWVMTHEVWLARQPQSLMVRKTAPVSGPDVGIIYVQRASSHAEELYKIGLTRRGAEERAAELSASTAAPSRFLVLAQWEVGDCAAVEKEVHKRLDAYRINPKREFFGADISTIISTVESVIATYASVT